MGSASYSDSTRHVVTALLRNCGYEVTAVADGLQAWKLLEDLTNHIDLVLTEVILPCLPGIGLLCKIMNQKTRKNTPVVMMSPHDSMSIVFKCLSKGAVDYLVKPIRNNELKNLWQHVWRKCHSVSCYNYSICASIYIMDQCCTQTPGVGAKAIAMQSPYVAQDAYPKFLYGDLGDEDAYPKFDLYINATKWSTVTILDASRI